MKKILLVVGVVAAPFGAFMQSAFAEICYYMPGDNHLSGDLDVSIYTCRQGMIDVFWDIYDFDKGDWDDGFGFHDPCNIDQPLARTFNGLFALHYAAYPNQPRNGDDFSGSFLRWAGNHSAYYIDELDCRCGSGQRGGGAGARTRHTGPVDEWTKVYWPFHYGGNIIYRASTIAHEARHVQDYNHEGGDDCLRRTSCDVRLEDLGANAWEVQWLWHFNVEATEWSQDLRDYAKDRGNALLRRAFVEPPGFQIP